MSEQPDRLRLVKIEPIWTAEMEEVVGPHIGTAFPGIRPAIGVRLEAERWFRIEASTEESVGFLWLKGGPAEVEISLVIRDALRRNGFGESAVLLAEDVIAAGGGSVSVGVIDSDNPAAEAVAALLEKCGYACHPPFSTALLKRLVSIEYRKSLTR